MVHSLRCEGDDNNLDKEDLVSLVIIKAFSEGFSARWDEMRALVASHASSEAIDEYFNKVFATGIKERILKAATTVYRARQIKTQDWRKTGVATKNIYDRFFSIIVTPEDVKNANKIENLPITLEDLFILKLGQKEQLTEDEQIQFNKFFEECSMPDFYGFPKAECGCPPKEFRKDQRLSTSQDECLYLSLEMDTAIYEMRPSNKQSYSVSKGKILKDVRLAELKDISKYNDIAEFELSTLLSKVSEANTDNDEGFYRITQRLSKFVEALDFDGIVYQSSIDYKGTNVMLFNPAMVEFTENSVISIDNVKVDYTVCFPLINENEQ